MERKRLTSAQALVGASQDATIKLHDVAARVVETGEEPMRKSS